MWSQVPSVTPSFESYIDIHAFIILASTDHVHAFELKYIFPSKWLQFEHSALWNVLEELISSSVKEIYKPAA